MLATAGLANRYLENDMVKWKEEDEIFYNRLLSLDENVDCYDIKYSNIFLAYCYLQQYKVVKNINFVRNRPIKPIYYNKLHVIYLKKHINVIKFGYSAIGFCLFKSPHNLNDKFIY